MYKPPLPIKLKFKKTAQHLYFKKENRDWLKECEKVLNSPKIQKEITKKFKKDFDNFILYGTGTKFQPSHYGKPPAAKCWIDIQHLINTP